MTTPGTGRDEYPYSYRGCNAGAQGTTGASFQGSQNYPSQVRGYPLSNIPSHQGYYQPGALAPEQEEYHKLYQPQHSSSGVGTHQRPSKTIISSSLHGVGHYNEGPRLAPSYHQPIAAPLHVSGGGGQQYHAISSYTNSHASWVQQGKTTYYHRQMQVCDDSDEETVDGGGASPNISPHGGTPADL